MRGDGGDFTVFDFVVIVLVAGCDLFDLEVFEVVLVEDVDGGERGEDDHAVDSAVLLCEPEKFEVIDCFPPISDSEDDFCL